MPNIKKQTKKKYIVNHNSGKIIMPNGYSFNFSDCIKTFDFPLIQEEALNTEIKEQNSISNINLKVVSLSQITALEEYILQKGFNPVFSIETGEIIHPADLCKYSAEEIINKVNNFCKKFNIKFRYGTPKELITRDFSRVFDTAKIICKQIKPYSIVINNEDFFKKFIFDKDLENINIEFGSGMDLEKQTNINLLKNFSQIQCVDLSKLQNLKNIKKFLQKIKSYVPKQKLTVCGSISVDSEGLCPLNSLPPEISRINCNAACQKELYAIEDYHTNSIYPFISDGFCKMHLYENKILDLSSYVQSFKQIGITEFTIDMSILKKEFVSILLTRFLNNQNKIIFKELKTMPKDTL